MEAHRRSEFSPRGLRLRTLGPDGAPTVAELPVYAGAIHYWRVAPSDWRACLASLRSLGLRLVDTYVPWSVHEQRPGSFDWTGRRDLRGFLTAVQDAGLYAILRPGPHINAELTLFGFPERVVANPDVQAVTARNTPMWMPAPPRMFPVPSYASRAFRDQVRAWFAAVSEQIADRLVPEGPVAALQVDNEHQQFFRVGAFDGDYHPDAVAWWRAYAGDVDPPRQWDPRNPGLGARWVAFQSHYAARALAWMTEALEQVGLGDVARFHNFPPTEPTLFDLPGGEAAIGGVAGVDFYHRARDLDAYSWRARHLVGSAKTLPFAPEVGVGGPPWLTPMSRRDQENVTLGLLAAGVRGLNFYMAVDRERWYEAAISDRGDVRPRGQWLRRLIEVLDELDWTALRRDASIALVVTRAEERHAIASSLADPLSPVLTELAGLAPHLSRDDEAREHRTWVTALREALERSLLAYAVIDENVDVDRLCQHQAVVMATGRRIEAGTWERLKQAAARGVRVVIGPGRPAVDAFDAPLADPAIPRGVGHFQRASMTDPAALARDLAGLVGGAPEHWVAPGEPQVTCSLFCANGAPRALFVANRGDRQVTAAVALPPGVELEDPLAGERVASVALAPYQVRLLRVV